MIVDERQALFTESCRVILNEVNRTGSSTTESEVTDKLVTKLFRNIKNVSSKSDFKMIEATRGDMEKLSNYGDLYNAELFLYNLINRTTKQTYLIHGINTLQNIRTNVVTLKVDFMRGFQGNNALVKTTYNTLVANYIMCLGGLIAHGITVYKDEFNIIRVSLKPDIKEADIVKLLEPLEQFNDLIKSGSFAATIRKYNKDRATLLSEDAKTPEGLLGLILDAIKGIFYSNPLTLKAGKLISDIKSDSRISKMVKVGGGIIVLLIILSRGAYMYYSARIILSKYLEEIALLVAVSSQENTNPEIKAKQEKAAKLFKKLADMLAVDSKVASQKSKDLSQKSTEDSVNETAKDVKNDNSSDSTSVSDEDEIF